MASFLEVHVVYMEIQVVFLFLSPNRQCPKFGPRIPWPPLVETVTNNLQSGK